LSALFIRQLHSVQTQFFRITFHEEVSFECQSQFFEKSNRTIIMRNGGSQHARKLMLLCNDRHYKNDRSKRSVKRAVLKHSVQISVLHHKVRENFPTSEFGSFASAMSAKIEYNCAWRMTIAIKPAEIKSPIA